MLPTIIFGLALLTSVYFLFDLISTSIAASISRRTRALGLIGTFCMFGAIVLWTWLYWLSH